MRWKINANAFQQDMFFLARQPFNLAGNGGILLQKLDFAFRICYGPRYLENEYLRGVTERVVSKAFKLFYGREGYNRFLSIVFLNLKLLDGNCSESKFCVFYLRNALNVECCIDLDGRTYRSWEDFLENNKLPRCFIAYPKFGKYYYHSVAVLSEGNETTRRNFVEVVFGESVSCSFGSFMKYYIDVLSAIGGFASAGILIYHPDSSPLLFQAFAGVVVTGSYAFYVGIKRLHDIHEHEGGLSLKNSNMVLTVCGLVFTVFGLLVTAADINSVKSGISFLSKYTLPMPYKLFTLKYIYHPV